MNLDVLVQRLDAHLPLPAYARPGDAGADLMTAVDVELAPGERAVLPTGVAIALPAGFAAFVHPRSGLAARHGVSLVNSPGTIDSGYRGEIQVVLVNGDPRETLRLRRGDRIAPVGHPGGGNGDIYRSGAASRISAGGRWVWIYGRIRR